MCLHVKTGWAWVAAWLIGVGMAGAQQVTVSLEPAYTVFVKGEPVVARLEALNATQDSIRAGSADAPDTALVEVTKGGRYNEIAAVNPEPITGPFELKPGGRFQREVELDKWFPMLEEGKYMVRLVIVHGGMRYESAKRSFDVVPGMPFSDAVQMFVNRQNQKRMFRMVHWNRNRADRLFLRIEDEPSKRVWDSIDLGLLLRTTDPKIDISPEGEETVVQRATRDAFIRTVLWSLPESVEIAEQGQLLDPEISASQRARELYGEMADDKKEEKKAWWKFW
jgi:hypothetical protein